MTRNVARIGQEQTAKGLEKNHTPLGSSPGSASRSQKPETEDFETLKSKLVFARKKLAGPTRRE